METNAKQEFQKVLDHLTAAEAADILTFARRLTTRRPVVTGASDAGGASAGRLVAGGLTEVGLRDPLRPRHAPPMLRRGQRIASADEVRGDVFPPEESQEDFEATLRRWREDVGSV